MKKLIDKFHRMEEVHNLFDIVDVDGNLIWDLFRYSIFIKYYYTSDDNRRIESNHSKSVKEYFLFIYKLLGFIYLFIFRKKNKYIIQVASRYKNGKLYYDKAMMPLINHLSKKDYIILETFTMRSTSYSSIYDLSFFFRRIYKSKKLDVDIYQRLEIILRKHLGECKISYKELNTIYNAFGADVKFYNFVIDKFKPSKIFTSVGNPKALVSTAKNKNIPVGLFQHAGFHYEEIEYSYPQKITCTHPNVIFADYLFTFGDLWSEGINIPTKKIVPIGNDFFSVQRKKEILTNNILVISTIVHGEYLAEFIHAFAQKNSNLNFIFKLHPNEFQHKMYYRKLFNNCPNIEIITSEIDTSILVNSASLIILIVSSVIYEAIDLNKKIAIYKKSNYSRNESLKNIPNVYFFEEEKELTLIMEKELQEKNTSLKYYKPFNEKILAQFL